MTRLLNYVPLMAAGAVLALTSSVQAQLDDGVQTIPFPGTVIDLPADGNPEEDVDVGDATGATLTQLNMNAGVDFATGDRTYSFTEFNVLAANGNQSTFPNSNAIFADCEINLVAADGFIGNNAMIDANSTLNMTDGEVRAGATVAGVANISGGGIGNPTVNGELNLSGGANIFGGSSVVNNGGVINASENSIIFGPFNVGAGGTLNVADNTDLRAILVAGVANLAGGVLNSSMTVQDGGVINIMDGASPGSGTTTINDGGTLNLVGGMSGSNTFVEAGGVLNASGGAFGTAANNPPGLNVLSGGTVNFSGTEFAIDGVPIASTPGQPFTVAERDGVLTGTLLDGGQINFDLSATSGGLFINFFDADSTVTVTVASSILLGDVNLDGVVDFLDISPFIVLLSTQAFQLEADINEDGTVDFLDISPFIVILSTS